ncbi:hypothetical protein SAMN05216588_12468 [Pseudomonas flavescens]|uniref:Uncharacterized protein n=1 Tax=Phytopseudomonas flavescens TaxID=29435 RepID=A0A1G8NCC1_9GAMM|nr:hypothetical protein [Pseudomonas flavescens]SDI77904.1 hypothetical protein SAMN05216588_12468 [Pseudomonas flavescens]
MTLSELRERAIAPALALLPARLSGAMAEVMLLSITQQEDPEQRRRQWPAGPARGLWQFEQAGGVRGVLNHVSSRKHALAVCIARSVTPEPATAWAALEHDDVLAAVFARLLLWTDPRPLPCANDPVGAWDLYERTWRPGKPHPQRWRARFAAAVREVA